MSDASFSRLFRLLQVVPGYPRTLDTTQITALLAADGFETTPRTVQRDLLKLEGMGLGVECLDTSKPYRWRMAQSAKPVLLPGLDLPQALALLLVEAHLSRLVPRAAWAALRPHLEAARKVVEGKPARRWLERVRVIPRTQPQSPPGVDTAILDAVQMALVEDRRLTVRYRRADKGDSDMELHPLGLVVRDAVAYLVATAFEYDDVRLYALHRMRAVTGSDLRSRKPPAGFDLDAWIEGGETGWRLAKEPIHLEVAFFDGAERSVLESPLSKDQSHTSMGDAVVVKATVNDTRILRAWLLGFGSSVEVRRPKALRTDFAAGLSKALARYSE